MENTTLRLTKKVAECSELSRREAATAIKKGEITVNGVVEKNPAAEIQETDIVARNGQPLVKKEKAEYFLFNKAKGMLFSEKSDKNRPSVLEIMAKYSKASLSSVQPIPDSACGLLLLSNDTVIIDAFQHKKKSIRQKYEVILKGILDRETLASLEKSWRSGKIPGFLDSKAEQKEDECVLEIDIQGDGIEQILDSLRQKNWTVIKADRVSMGGMTKKDISRGWYRPLSEKEIIWLKHFN